MNRAQPTSPRPANAASPLVLTTGQRAYEPRRSRSLRQGMILLVISLVFGCTDAERNAQSDAVCLAVEQERFDDALALSESGSSATGAGREVAQCRCLALLAKNQKTSCTDLLEPLLTDSDATDWIPRLALTRLMVQTWQAQGQIDQAAQLASRAAPLYRQDLALLQAEMKLRTSVEDEVDVLRDIDRRLGADPSWIPQRLILALAWNGRSEHDEALRVLGTSPPPERHPLTLPWFESRIKAHAAKGDLDSVRRVFDEWRSTGWDPDDLAARYALRLSTDHLVDPDHDGIELMQAALKHQDRLRDRSIVWGLHRRLITDLLGAGRPEEALEAYDAAEKVVSLEGVTREEILRAIAQASGQPLGEAPATLVFTVPPSAVGGQLQISPPGTQAPDSAYTAFDLASENDVVLESPAGLHPRRWVLKDAEAQLLASGSVWPVAGNRTIVRPQPRDPSLTEARIPRVLPPRKPADGRRRVFAILGDCADWRLAQYLSHRGDLPFHDHLMDQGYRAVLESRPAFTAAAMQALVWPAKKDVPSSLGWIHHLGLELAGLESIGRNPVSWLSFVLPSRPNLFETLGGGELVTANMLLSHGRIDAGRHAELIGPAGARRAMPTMNAYRPLRQEEHARHPALRSDPDTQKFAETIAAEMDAANEVARAGEVDFLFLRLEALDLMTHAHYAAVDGRGQDDGGGALFAAYRYIDERLAELNAELDEDDWLIYLSDHGVRSAMQHEEDAMFIAVGAGVPAGRAEGQPELRGVPRSLATMFDIETDWPDTGTTPWLTQPSSEASTAVIAPHGAQASKVAPNVTPDAT